MKQGRAFFISLIGHAVFMASLIWLGRPASAPEMTTFDLVTLQPSGDARMRSAGAAQSETRQKKQAAKKFEATASTEASPEQSAAVRDETNSQDESIGEAHLQASFGRAPKNEAERYLATIRDRIAVQQAYPPASRAFREEGMVMLRLTIDRSGSLTKVEMIEASPFKRLNDAAMRAVLKAAPFGAFPEEVAFQTWKITLPVRFTLAGS